MALNEIESRSTIFKNLAERIIDDPNEIESLSEEDIIAYLSYLKKFLEETKEFPLIRIPLIRTETYKKKVYLYVAGDLHGDFKTTLQIAKNILLPAISTKKNDVRVIFLGDYVDRAPADCENGGLKTVLLLLSLKMLYPRNIYLLRGNHEAYSLLQFTPHELPKEIADVWGFKNLKEIYKAFEEIFSLLPLYVLTRNGVYMAHGGFPKNTHDISRITLKDKDAILQTLWGDLVETDTYRGEISKKANFSCEELHSFLRTIGAKVMLRGHDYRILGSGKCNKTLLTLFTSRRYKDKGRGGVLIAKFSLSKPIRSIKDIRIIDISTEKKEKYHIISFRKKQKELGERDEKDSVGSQ